MESHRTPFVVGHIKKVSTVAMIAAFGLAVSSCSSPLKYPERTSQKPVKAQSSKPVNQCKTPYVVKSGDTLSGIAYRCKINMKQIAKLNGLLPPYIIYIKQELMLPAPNVTAVKPNKTAKSIKPTVSKTPSKQVERPKTVTTNKPKTQPVVNTRKEVTAKAISRPVSTKSYKKSKSKAWVWPMHKALTYKYRRDNAGLSVLEIYGVPGQKVKAVAPGKVVYSGNGILNYGWMLVVKHDNDYMSIYAHNSALLVQEGDVVDAGQEVATLGATGNTNRPKLYVEARYQGRKIDIKKILKQ